MKPPSRVFFRGSSVFPHGFFACWVFLGPRRTPPAPAGPKACTKRRPAGSTMAVRPQGSGAWPLWKSPGLVRSFFYPLKLTHTSHLAGGWGPHLGNSSSNPSDLGAMLISGRVIFTETHIFTPKNGWCTIIGISEIPGVGPFSCCWFFFREGNTVDGWKKSQTTTWDVYKTL